MCILAPNTLLVSVFKMSPCKGTRDINLCKCVWKLLSGTYETTLITTVTEATASVQLRAEFDLCNQQ